MDTSVNAANQVVSVGADIAFDAVPKFFACLVRFESSSVPTTLPTAYDVYPLDGRHDGVYFFFSSRRRHTRCGRDWSSDVCSSDLVSRARSVSPLLYWIQASNPPEDSTVLGLRSTWP